MNDDDAVVFGDDDDDYDNRSLTPEVPGYDLLELIGKDGLNDVYRARQRSLDRVVAICVSRTPNDARASQMLLEEAAILVRLQHPHIVSIIDCIENYDRVYLVLELVDGSSLQASMDGQHSHIHAATLVEQVARTLAFAHYRGVTHCDLKPSNVLLAVPPSADEETPGESRHCESAYGIPVLRGFGLALDDKRRATFEDGQCFGTLAYMAPEQAGGNVRDIGPPADVYALGVLLYELLTGRRPFSRDGVDVQTFLSYKMNKEPESVSKLNPTVDINLEGICHRCLRISPESRPTALELAHDLQDWCDATPPNPS